MTGASRPRSGHSRTWDQCTPNLGRAVLRPQHHNDCNESPVLCHRGTIGSHIVTPGIDDR
eukprot:336925-Rhodomonas_salina.1